MEFNKEFSHATLMFHTECSHTAFSTTETTKRCTWEMPEVTCTAGWWLMVAVEASWTTGSRTKLAITATSVASGVLGCSMLMRIIIRFIFISMLLLFVFILFILLLLLFF